MNAFNAARRSQITTTDAKPSPRHEQLRRWLEGIDGLDVSTLALASEDASFRRYLRLVSGDSTKIVMDAPPDVEDSAQFVKVAGFLERMHLNSPRVLASDLELGFLLLTDLGSTLYLTALRQDRSMAGRLYDDALSALVKMQRRGKEFQSELPTYDEKLLSFELSIFKEWLCERHLNIDFTQSDEDQWKACCQLLIDNALNQPRVFVHRDYHSRNLMLTEDNNPGILDFQDAVEGPLTYDLVSLLKDCYIRWTEDKLQYWAMQFYDQIGDQVNARIDTNEFDRCFDLMGAQRHLKAAGIFARLKHRDGKPGFLPDIPRTLEYIVALESRYEELDFLINLISQRCLPRLGDKQ